MQQSQTGFNKTLMLRNRAIETEFFCRLVPDESGPRGTSKLGFFLCFALFPPVLVGAGLFRSENPDKSGPALGLSRFIGMYRDSNRTGHRSKITELIF